MTVSSLVLLIFVGLAGSLGALTRYMLGRYIAERVSSQFPLGTLVINVTGAFVIGLLFTFTGRDFISVPLQTVLATGFLGGYTTFSTMSWESVQLVRGGSTPLGLLYLGGSVLLGLLAAVLGMMLGWEL
jgi:fluoride exporter